MISFDWDRIRELWWKSISRFPLSYLFSILTAISLLILIRDASNRVEWIRIFSSSILFYPVSIAVQLWIESGKISKLNKIFIHIAVLGLASVWYFFSPDHDVNSFRYLFILLIISSHCSVLVLPFLNQKSESGFWVFNQELLMSWILGLCYGLIIALGIEAAVVAIEYLFDVRWYSEIYLDVFVVMFAVFSTSYFSSNIPDSLVQSIEDFDYKKTYQVFIKFILIPLVILYFLILYAYGLKILFQWELPKGWLGSLCLGFSSLGILVYLLSHRMPEWDGAALIRNYKKYFISSLIPVVILLGISIGVRILEYGLTEQRYLVLLFTLWTSSLLVYHLILGKSDLRYYPLTIMIISVLASFGPLGIHKVSLQSQTKQLTHFCEFNQLIENGFWKPSNHLSEKDYNRLANLLNYLNDKNALDPWIDKISDSVARKEILAADRFMQIQKMLEFISPVRNPGDNTTEYLQYFPPSDKNFEVSFDQWEIADIQCDPWYNYEGKKSLQSFFISENEEDLIYVSRSGETIKLHIIDSLKAKHAGFKSYNISSQTDLEKGVNFYYTLEGISVILIPRTYSIEKFGDTYKIKQFGLWKIQIITQN
ncbi:MAG: DUF4153 domain-containing protein [Saprospiraceae bacterium]|nr:DUF4153 domain-containing protein [Saprospiraceae bacterium]